MPPTACSSWSDYDRCRGIPCRGRHNLSSMDYDKTEIPTSYARARDHGPAFQKQWMDTIATYVEPQSVRTVLDLGCGTGRFSEGIAEHFNAAVIGIDPSRKMLAEAQSNLSHPNV